MFEKVASGFSLDNVIDLSMLDTLPDISHTYGGKTDIPDELCWMTYKSSIGGEISFTRNTSKFLPELANHVITFLDGIVNVPLLPERVHFLRTRGSIEPHVDEAGRNCCLNIGIKNSNSAITRIHKDDQTFDFVCQDGSMYLLDTAITHSVAGDKDISRLLITYGFGVKFGVIKSRLKNVG